MKQTNISKIYLEKDVLTSARERISYMFDEFKNIWVSISGGKDSTVLFHLVHQEAIKRHKKINVFFLDQEAEYQSSIDVVKQIMQLPLVIPYWLQIPLRMTNSVSYEQDYMNIWAENEKHLWMRKKDKLAIDSYSFKSDRFYGFIEEFNNTYSNSCWFVGLRSEESLNRFRAMKKIGYKATKWTTYLNKKKNITNAYPIYDFTFEDVWKYIFEFKINYNTIYDKQFMLEYNLTEMRVSNLIHEMSYKCLRDLPKFEPDTYNKLQKRLKGIATAQRYAKKIQIFNTKRIPKSFKSYKEWRNNLLLELPLKAEKKQLFIDRFEKQIKKHSEQNYIYKHQVRQLLMNDWENNLPLIIKNETELNIYEKWKKIL